MVVGLKHEMSVESGTASVSTGAEEEEEKRELSTGTCLHVRTCTCIHV